MAVWLRETSRKDEYSSFQYMETRVFMYCQQSNRKVAWCTKKEAVFCGGGAGTKWQSGYARLLFCLNLNSRLIQDTCFRLSPFTLVISLRHAYRLLQGYTHAWPLWDRAVSLLQER